MGWSDFIRTLGSLGKLAVTGRLPRERPHFGSGMDPDNPYVFHFNGGGQVAPDDPPRLLNKGEYTGPDRGRGLTIGQRRALVEAGRPDLAQAWRQPGGDWTVADESLRPSVDQEGYFDGTPVVDSRKLRPDEGRLFQEKTGFQPEKWFTPEEAAQRDALRRTIEGQMRASGRYPNAGTPNSGTPENLLYRTSPGEDVAISQGPEAHWKWQMDNGRIQTLPHDPRRPAQVMQLDSSGIVPTKEEQAEIDANSANTKTAISQALTNTLSNLFGGNAEQQSGTGVPISDDPMFSGGPFDIRSPGRAGRIIGEADRTYDSGFTLGPNTTSLEGTPSPQPSNPRGQQTPSTPGAAQNAPASYREALDRAMQEAIRLGGIRDKMDVYREINGIDPFTGQPNKKDSTFKNVLKGIGLALSNVAPIMLNPNISDKQALGYALGAAASGGIYNGIDGSMDEQYELDRKRADAESLVDKYSGYYDKDVGGRAKEQAILTEDAKAQALNDRLALDREKFEETKYANATRRLGTVAKAIKDGVFGREQSQRFKDVLADLMGVDDVRIDAFDAAKDGIKDVKFVQDAAGENMYIVTTDKAGNVKRTLLTDPRTGKPARIQDPRVRAAIESNFGRIEVAKIGATSREKIAATRNELVRELSKRKFDEATLNQILIEYDKLTAGVEDDSNLDTQALAEQAADIVAKARAAGRSIEPK